METEMDVRDTEKPEEIGHSRPRRSCTPSNKTEKSSNSLIKSGIIETNNNYANETVSFSTVAQLSIRNNALGETSEKKQTRCLFADGGQEETKTFNTITANDSSANDKDAFSQILMEIDLIQKDDKEHESMKKNSRERETTTEEEIRNKGQSTEEVIPRISPLKLVTIETQYEVQNDTVLPFLQSLMENNSMLNDGIAEPISKVIEVNDNNASKIKDEAMDEVSSSTNSKQFDTMPNDPLLQTIEVLKRRGRGRPRKDRTQSEVTASSEDTRSEYSNEIISSTDSMQVNSVPIYIAAKTMGVPKRRRRLLKKVNESQGVELKDDAARGIRGKGSTESLCLSHSMKIDVKTDKVSPKTMSMPQTRSQRPVRLCKLKVTSINDDTACGIKDSMANEISLKNSLQADTMLDDVAPKITSVPKSRRRVKCRKEVTKSRVSRMNNNNIEGEILKDTTEARLKSYDSTISAVIEDAIRASQLEDLMKKNESAKITIKTDSILETILSTENKNKSENNEQETSSKLKSDVKNTAVINTPGRSPDADSISLGFSKPTFKSTLEDETSDNFTNKEIFAMYGISPKKTLEVEPVFSEISMHEKSKSEINTKKITSKPVCARSKKRTTLRKTDVDNNLKNQMKNNTIIEVEKTISQLNGNSNKNISLDDLKQLKVVLFDIAYSNKLTPKQKEMLLSRKKINERNVCLTNAPVSSTHQNIVNLATVDIATTVSPKIRKTLSGKPMESVSRTKVKALKDEPSTPRKCRRRKTPKITMQSNTVRQKTQPKIQISNPIQLPPCAGFMPSRKFISPSKSSYISNQQKSCSFSELSSVQGSNIKTKPTELVKLDHEDCENQFMFKTPELELPLNLSIQSLKTPMDRRSDILQSPNTSSVNLASQTKNFSLPYHQHSLSNTTTIPQTGLSKSFINITDIKPSPADTQSYLNLPQQQRLNELIEERDVNGNENLQKIQNANSTPLNSNVSVSSGILTNSEPIEKKQLAFENRNSKINTSANKRCMPKILSDKALPKGTILLPSIGHSQPSTMLRSNMDDKQRFIYPNETKSFQESSDYQFSTFGQIAQQDNRIIQTQPEKSNAKDDGMEMNSTKTEPFDSSQLWKYCPEFADFLYDVLGDDDNVNNNHKNKNVVYKINENTNSNDNNLSNSDTLKINEKNTDFPIIIAKKTETNASDKHLLSNNTTYLAKTENDPQPVSAGVIARSVNCIMSESNEQSLESIVTEIDSKLEKPVVLADLTIANLTNFTKNLNHEVEKDRLNNYIELYQYSSHSQTEKCIEFVDGNKVSNVCGEATASVKIGSSFENQNRHIQGKTTTLKRKWAQDENEISCKPSKTKRRKLDRERFFENVEGNSTTVSCSPIPDSVTSNINNNSVKTVINANTTPKNTTYESKLLDEQFNEESKILKEREMIRSEFDVLQDYNLSIPDYNMKINKSTQSIEPADIIVSEDVGIIEYNSDNENLPKDGLCLAILTTAVAEQSNSKLDENGNSTSSSSSSSPSSLSSSKSAGNPERITSSKILKATNLGKDDNMCCNKSLFQNKNKEELDYEPDDCISLFAESIISTHLNESLNFINNNAPPYDPSGKPQDSFHYMTDISTYFERNVQECNAAYESAMETDETRQATDPNNTPNAFARSDTINSDTISCRKIPIPGKNLQREDCSKPLKYSAPDSPQEIVDQKEIYPEMLNHSEDTTCAKKDSPNNLLTHLIVQDLFRGHCYSKLRRGVCHKMRCQYSHNLSSNLQNIYRRDLSELDQILNHAIFQGYRFYTTYVYSEFLTQIDAEKIFLLFYKLLKAHQMSNYTINSTIDALARTGMSLKIIAKNIANKLDENDDFLAERILSVSESKIEPGTYWETFRDLLIRKDPPAYGLQKVLEECIYTNKDRSHIRDVYINYVRRLTAEKLSNVNAHLKEQFDYLVTENEIKNEAENFADSSHLEITNFNVVLETQISAETYRKQQQQQQKQQQQQRQIPTISSPNCNQQTEKIIHFPEKNIQVSQRSSSQGSFASRSLGKNENSSSHSKASIHNFFDQRRNNVSQVSSLVKNDSPNLSITTGNIYAENSFGGIYKLHQIDDLAEPRSAYRDRHCDYHLSIEILKEVLKRQDYETVLNILNKYSDKMDRTLFTTSLYNILRKNVITSTHHLKNLIKLSVELGVNKLLSRTLFKLGIYTMIELCDTGVWVLAYDLFKFLRNTGSLENIAAYTLISTEICLANGHPLKAFNILKRDNMFTANRNKWRLASNPNDEHVRIRIISLLSDVLCEKYPEQAFYLFKQLCREQGHTYYPTDLTALIDKLVTGIISGKCSESITDVGRFVLKSNFALRHCVFRNLVVKIFERDTRLSKQLYHYGTWLGIYPIVKLTLPLRVLIKTNWTKEEMYLVVVDFLEKLSMDVGPAIDRIGPNKFSIHLIFELAPFEEQFVDSEVETRNMDELNTSKKLMKTVLQEQFNPSIRTIKESRDRFVKLQSRSVVYYLKSLIQDNRDVGFSQVNSSPNSTSQISCLISN